MDALAVVGGQACGGERVNLRQLGMQRGPTCGLATGFKAGTHGGVGTRQIVNAVQQCLEVQHGATHEQRRSTPRLDFTHKAFRIGHKLGGAVSLQRVTDIDQVVRHQGKLLRSGLGGADVHAPVHQGGIDADEFSPPALQSPVRGQGHRQRGFAAGGGACDADPSGNAFWAHRNLTGVAANGVPMR